MTVAVLGAGNGGAAAAVELSQKGFKVRLWNRSPGALVPFEKAGGIRFQGVLGDGVISPELISTDLSRVLNGAELILICLPTFALPDVALAIAQTESTQAIVLNPGHTGGALEFAHSFRKRRKTILPIAEFSTLTYVARKSSPECVNITGTAQHVWVAPYPGGRAAVDLAQQVFPCAEEINDVLATSLANVNMVLHPPGAILGASWIESTQGDFTFYVQGLSPGVGRIMQQLDRERLELAAAFGHRLPDLYTEMKLIGTIENNSGPDQSLTEAISSGRANQKIKAPDSLDHRYYLEDFWYGLKPFIALAKIAQVEVPVAQSLLNLAEILRPDLKMGRTADSMGIANFDKKELLAFVRN